jgi:hypothetical protein
VLCKPVLNTPRLTHVGLQQHHTAAGDGCQISERAGSEAVADVYVCCTDATTCAQTVLFACTTSTADMRQAAMAMMLKLTSRRGAAHSPG